MSDAMEWGPVIDHDASGQPVPKGTLVCARLADRSGPLAKPWVAVVTTRDGAIWKRRPGDPVRAGRRGLRVVSYQLRQPVAVQGGGARHGG